MSRLSRWISIAGLVCGSGLLATAAMAQQSWTSTQGGQWMVDPLWTTLQRGGWAPAIAPANPRPKLYDWNGWYIGVNFGGSWSTATTTEFLAGTDRVTNSFINSGQSWMGGINGGYDWQVGQWVFGVVVDANGVHDQVRMTFPNGNYIGTTFEFSGSLRGRVGVLPTQTFLIYATGGLAFGSQRNQIDFGGPETDDRRFIVGGTFGGGVEAKLPYAPGFAKSTSVFLEYRFTQWQDTKLSRPVASPGFDYKWETSTNTLQTGFRVGF